MRFARGAKVLTLRLGAKRAITVLVSAAAVLASASAAFACSCMETGPPCQAFWKAEAVFDATVEGMDPTSRQMNLGSERSINVPEKIVHLKVRQAWKGVEAGPLDVLTAADGAACGYDFKPGKRYLVFALKRPFDGRWSVSLCSATREYDGSGDSAAFLASLAEPPKGGRIFGSIKSMERTFGSDSSYAEHPVETRVRLLGNGQERAVASAGGTFEFTGLARGAYRLIAEPPDGFTTYGGERTIELVDERACARVDYSFSPAGRITGRVVDTAGHPLPPQISIEANTADARGQPGGVSWPSAFPNDQGGFEIGDLPPGRYIVGINLENAPPSQYRPYARTIYPSDGSDGMTITIDRGQSFDLGDWKIPPPVPTVRVDGIVVWEDGTPATGLRVVAMDVTENPKGGFVANATTAMDGRFSIELRQRRVYTFVLSDKQGRLPISPLRVDTALPPSAPIRLMIQRKPR